MLSSDDTMILSGKDGIMHKRSSFRMAISVLACLATIDMAAAYYSPSQGRWISRDPLPEAGFQLTSGTEPIRGRERGKNKGIAPEVNKRSIKSFLPRDATGSLSDVAFVNNSPVAHVDPNGLVVFKCCRAAELATVASCGGKHCYLMIGNDDGFTCAGMAQKPDTLNKCIVGRGCDKQRNPDDKPVPPDVTCELLTDIEDDSYDDCIRTAILNTEEWIRIHGCCWAPNRNCENMANSWLRQCGLSWSCENPGFCDAEFPGDPGDWELLE